MANDDWDEQAHARDGRGRFSGDKVSLREFLERVFDERWRAHQELHDSEQKALRITADTVKTWKDDSNEWRGTLGDRDRAYAKVGDTDGLDRRLRLVETANERREATERERLVNEAREKQEDDRRQSRQLQWLSIALGLPAVLGAVAGVIALVRG